MAQHEQLSLDNLRLLAQHLERVVHDCLDRPFDNAARKVTITFNVKPDPEPGSTECDNVSVEAEIESTVPKHRTRPYSMLPTTKGQLKFNPDLPEEPDGE